MRDLVTVCICTYNREKLLKRCLDSVIEQTYKNLEIIIVDDNSSDGTEKLVKEYILQGYQIKYYKNDKNMGLAYNRNVGIEKAQGMYFCFVDDDDYWHPNFIQTYVDNARRHDQNTIFCGGYRELYKDAVIEYYYGFELPLIEAIKRGYTPPVASQFYPTKTLREIKGYNIQIKSGVDHDLWIRLIEKDVQLVLLNGGYAFVNNDIIDDTRMTINYENRQKLLMDSINIWDEKLKEIDKYFPNHFKESYSYYLKSKFAIINIKKHNLKNAVKLFMECPFKGFFIKQMCDLVYRKMVKLYKYNIMKKKLIRFKIKNSFPAYNRKIRREQ